jgi:1-acyl-sn-glycerol-3-phosphate acyltransferase
VQEWKLEPARDLGMPLKESLLSHRRETGLIETAIHLTWWGIVRTYLIMGHRLRIEGRENLPKQPPFVLLGNHTSHLDALVLGAAIPWRLHDRVFPIAAGDTFFDNPLKTTFAAGVLNALPMWRRKTSTQALKQLRERLVEQSCGYIIFPEGTRSRDGKLNHFKPGLGMLLAETDIPTVPCHLRGAFEAWPAHKKWPRLGRISLRIGEPLRFATVANDRTGWEAIARTCEDVVRKLGGTEINLVN